MVSIAQLKAQSKYDKLNTRQIALKFNKNNDADILAKLESTNNKQGYLKELIRKDMRQNEAILSIDSIKFLLLPVVKKYEISHLSIFGSYARGEATPSSDIDILIDGGNYHGLIEYMDMINSMKNALKKDVDVITESSLKDSASKADQIFLKNIEKDKVVLI